MINSGLFSSDDSTWETPPALFNKLNAQFGPFTLDPCATPETAKCAKFYTRKENGLAQSWSGERVFINPPYGRDIIYWMRKCSQEYLKAEIICALIPARTDTRWFQRYVLPFVSMILFVAGRVNFVGSTSGSPFPSLIVIYDKSQKEFDSGSFEQ